MIPGGGIYGNIDGSRFPFGPHGYERTVQNPTPRATLAALALAVGLGFATAACSKADDSQPTSPATNLSPASSAQRTEANTVPSGASGQGSQGGQGQGNKAP